jgi:hypothetical protein
VQGPEPLRLFELIHASLPAARQPGTARVNHIFIAAPFRLDKNKIETYKNIPKTTEVLMLSFLKDALAFITIAGFSVASLGWMDIASRLV